MTNYSRLIFTCLVLVSGTILVALGKISGATWGTLLVGLLLPSPLEKGDGSNGNKGGLLMSCVAFLGLLASCSVHGPDFTLGGTAPASVQMIGLPPAMSMTAPMSYSAPLFIQPQAGILTDMIAFNPQASTSCPSGKGCMYVKNADSLFYSKDAAGLELKLHAAQSFRTSTNCSGLSSPSPGDVCYDTTIPGFRFFGSTWTTGAIDGSLYVAKAGIETITGAKTFTATTTLGAVTLTGNVNAGSNYITSLSDPVNPQDAATKHYVDTPAMESANVFLAGPTTGAAAAVSYRALVPADVPSTVWASPGAIGSTTPSTGAFTTVSIHGAPVDPIFHRVCTLTSAAAGTAVVCLLDADVPASKKAYLFHFQAKVNGGSAWATVTSCYIEDTSGNAFVTIPVASLTANAYLGEWTGSLTFDNRLTLSTGGTTAKGLQVRCDVNGTGSDLVVTLVGITK